MIRQEDVYRIGRIGKPHGVGGELTFAFDDDVFDRCDAEYLVLDIDGILVPFFMESYRSTAVRRRSSSSAASTRRSVHATSRGAPSFSQGNFQTPPTTSCRGQR